jgi:hypothetical protein
MKRILALIALLASATAKAQQLPASADSAIARAAKLAEDKDSVAAARHLLDSVANGGESQLVRGEATYQLSRLASSAADRERILSAMVIDYPFSSRLPAALHDLGMLELARNDRDRAAVHLSRFLSVSTPPDSARIPAALALGRLLVERGDLPRGCATLLVGRTELPPGAIEIKNQFEFSISRCQGVDTAATAPKPAADSLSAPQRTGAFTVQVAAYDTKNAAERLATTLRGQGLEARVIGTAKPFRVRVGRYATREEAEEASRRIDKLAKSKSLVVVVGPEEP